MSYFPVSFEEPPPHIQEGRGDVGSQPLAGLEQLSFKEPPPHIQECQPGIQVRSAPPLVASPAPKQDPIPVGLHARHRRSRPTRPTKPTGPTNPASTGPTGPPNHQAHRAHKPSLWRVRLCNRNKKRRVMNIRIWRMLLNQVQTQELLNHVQTVMRSDRDLEEAVLGLDIGLWNLISAL